MTAWADAVRAADLAMAHAEAARWSALQQRCPEVSSGGIPQCSADAEPAHEHRYSKDDLPGYDPAQI